jgi:hypothetical protein
MSKHIMDHDKDKWLNHPNYPLVLENLKKFCKSDWETKQYGMNFNIGERTYRFIRTRGFTRDNAWGAERGRYSLLEIKDPTFDFKDRNRLFKTWNYIISGCDVETLGFHELRAGFTSKEVRTKMGREYTAMFLVFMVFDDCVI